MMKKIFISLGVAVLLVSCGSFYSEPKDGEAASSVAESGERRSLTWYETFAVSQIDGFPVSHMGSDLGGVTVRVAPGRRKVLVTATYLHGMQFALNPNTTCPCRAEFPLDVEIPAGRKFLLAGSFDETGNAKISFVDATTKEPLFDPVVKRATPVPKNGYVKAPGGTWIMVPSKTER